MKKKTKNKSATKQKAVHRNEKIKRNVSDNTTCLLALMRLGNLFQDIA